MAKKLSIFIALIFSVSVAFWNISLERKKSYLLKFALPYQNQCVSSSECLLKPNGWVYFSPDSFYDPSSSKIIEYRATNASFEMRWKVATGITLVASGGKNKTLDVRKEVD